MRCGEGKDVLVEAIAGDASASIMKIDRSVLRRDGVLPVARIADVLVVAPVLERAVVAVSASLPVVVVSSVFPVAGVVVTVPATSAGKINGEATEVVAGDAPGVTLPPVVAPLGELVSVVPDGVFMIEFCASATACRVVLSALLEAPADCAPDARPCCSCTR